MKLKNSLQLSAVFPIVLAIVVSLSFFMRSQQISRSTAEFRKANALVEAASKLNAATHDCVIDPGKEACARWQTAFDSMAELTRTTTFSDQGTQIVFERTHVGLGRVKDRFAVFVAEQEKDSPAGKALGARLRMDSLSVTGTALEIAREAASRSAGFQENLDMIFAAFIGILGLVMAASTLAITGDVVKGITRLDEWVRKAPEQKFDRKFKISSRDDEIGRLANAFVDMVGRLKKSRDILETEAEEHKSVAGALRQSNMQLSDALIRLRRAQQQIVKQERLHAFEQVVRGIAHRFNNTLMPILGTSEFLLAYPDSLKEADKMTQHWQTVNDAAMQAKNDVKSLFDFFAPCTGGDARAVDINLLIQEAIRFTEPRWKQQSHAEGREIQVGTRLSEVPPVAGNEPELREVLVHLLLNALDAMPRGGKITVSSRTVGQFVIVEVRDTGVGMSEQEMSRCQEPFFSTKGDGGTGMGLTVASGTVRRLGGKLEIATEKGSGTTVVMHLPVWQEVERVGGEDELDLRMIKPLRILVVDDESWSREIAEKMLSAEGHAVETAANGEECLGKLKQKEFDLVITDKAMPDISGDQLAKMIKNAFPEIPVVLLTGFADLMMEGSVMPSGVDFVLGKPVTVAELKKAVAKCV